MYLRDIFLKVVTNKVLKKSIDTEEIYLNIRKKRMAEQLNNKNLTLEEAREQLGNPDLKKRLQIS